MNYTIIVERDNHRVQIFKLPKFISLGFFGTDKLIRPYGIAAFEKDHNIELFVTDDYEIADEQIPIPGKLGHRVHHYRLHIQNDSLKVHHIKAFGATRGAGMLHKVESIFADMVYHRLMIADEGGSAASVKVYNMEGRFSGTILGAGLFRNDPEGIALYGCKNGSGYWIMTDQSMQENVFRIFDRKTLKQRGAFIAAKTLNTDGVALTHKSFGLFEQGAFFPVNDDGNIAAISLFRINSTFGPSLSCN